MADWLTLAEAKAQLQIEADMTDHDLWIEDAIGAAAGTLERAWDIIVSPKAVTLNFPAFAPTLPLRLYPVRSVTAVRYLDVTDTLQTVDPAVWRMGTANGQAMLVRRYGQAWPSTTTYPDAVQVEVAAGPALPADLPEDIRMAAKMMVTHWFEQRSTVLVGTLSREIEYAASYLLNPFRQSWVG